MKTQVKIYGCVSDIMSEDGYVFAHKTNLYSFLHKVNLKQKLLTQLTLDLNVQKDAKWKHLSSKPSVFGVPSVGSDCSTNPAVHRPNQVVYLVDRNIVPLFPQSLS